MAVIRKKCITYYILDLFQTIISGQCQNVPGSYNCLCNPGFGPDETGTTCIDSDECGDETFCQFGCENMMGTYRCECPIGFTNNWMWNQCVGK